jgi:hypothetical protein
MPSLNHSIGCPSWNWGVGFEIGFYLPMQNSFEPFDCIGFKFAQMIAIDPGIQNSGIARMPLATK